MIAAITAPVGGHAMLGSCAGTRRRPIAARCPANYVAAAPETLLDFNLFVERVIAARAARRVR